MSHTVPIPAGTSRAGSAEPPANEHTRRPVPGLDRKDLARPRLSDIDLGSAGDSFDIDRAEGNVIAKAGDRPVRVGRMTRGSLPAQDNPDEFGDQVKVYARTRLDDIVIHRAAVRTSARLPRNPRSRVPDLQKGFAAMVGTTSGAPEQGHVGRRTVLTGVLGAGALAGLAGHGTASASVSGSDGGECGVARGWGKVADAFHANFDGPGEVGAACSVYVGGRLVVNLWDGLADREANRPWRRNTIMQVASTTKGATAICAHLLVQRGLLDLDAPVVRYWPEFGGGGKEGILVRWLLSHQAGLPIVDGPLTFEQACAWDPVIRALEAQKPLWQPGTEHIYHAMTYGFLVGEVVRRITGKSLGTFFAEEVARPLGLSAWIGLPKRHEPRVARIHHAAPFSVAELLAGMIKVTGLDEATVTAWVNALYSPGSVAIRAGELGGAFDNTTSYFTTRAWRAAEFPAANMVADAHSIARMYAATVSNVNGVRLLNPSTVEAATEIHTDKTPMHGLPPGLDIPADRSFNMSLGFWRACPPYPMVGPASFGHPGSGGSVGFADPDSGVGFGYVTNLWNFRPDDPRATNLANAVRSCLG